MKLIIAGSRHFANIDISGYIKFFDLAPTEVVCGGAYGVDWSGGIWGDKTSTPVKIFFADWNKHGKAAGPIRNKEMAEYADALLLIWDGKSKGSASMLREMKKLGKPIYEVTLKAY